MLEPKEEGADASEIKQEVQGNGDRLNIVVQVQERIHLNDFNESGW